MKAISHTDLILNPDGSIYHLNLLPEDIADNVILVGDPGRVETVSSHFDKVELKKVNREFVTHTGTYRGKRFSVLSTGIGTDNIDIVLNELDALVNIDLEQRTLKNEHHRLNLVRIGTCGALNAEIKPGGRVLTRVAGGLDGLYHFYKDHEPRNIEALATSFLAHTGWPGKLSEPYFIPGSETLLDLLSEPDQADGITLSTPGFYAPQMRSIRLESFDTELIEKLDSFTFEGMHINNFEMESSALYALSSFLGHRAATICVAVANRISLEFLEDYHQDVDALITMVLNKLAAHD